MRLTLLCLNTFIAILFFWVIPARADWPEMDAQIDATNVILGDHSDPFCSGTVISKKDRLILTADHCVGQMFSTRSERKVDPKTGEVREVIIEEQAGMMDVWQNKYLDYEVIGQNHFFAKVKARNSQFDAAVLQVVDPDWTAKDVAKFAPATWKIKRGQDVYVVGNPAGILDASVSKGIVSNTQRKLKVTNYPTNYFQIDAAIIGGNSGGAVYNSNGELIGVVSAAMRSSTIGFIVPISEVKDMLATAGYPEFGGKTVKPVTSSGGYPYGGPMMRLKSLFEFIQHMDR